MEEKTKGKAGITLTALVITVIVILILSGVSISILIGDNGILQNALQAKRSIEAASLKEEQQLIDVESAMQGVYGSSEGYDY